MLSDNDLYNALGKGIAIYPFAMDNVESGSIYVTASNLAWSLSEVRKNSKEIIVNDNIITIPANDTVIIVSNEIIALNNKFAGTCHSRMGISGYGLSYSSTPIKPGTCGKLLITIHNHNFYDVNIRIGERIAVIMFYQLKTKARKCINKNHANYAILNQLGIKLEQRDLELLSDIKNYDSKEVNLRLKDSGEFKKYIKKYQRKIQWKDAILIGMGVLLIIEILILFRNIEDNIVKGITVTIPITSTFIQYLMSKRK